MANQAPTIGTVYRRETGEVVATNVSAEDYMQQYAHLPYEWVGGTVIQMPAISMRHDMTVSYLRKIFDAYFELNPIGRIFGDPFVQRIDGVPSRRHPDLQIILHTNPGQLTETEMIGPADLCIEVVSAGNAADDYGEKFLEYEKGGVSEYWIIDHRRRTSLFYRLDETGVYQNHLPDAEGYYQTPLLPKLKLHIPTLWQDDLPGYFAIGRAVQAMFEEE